MRKKYIKYINYLRATRKKDLSKREIEELRELIKFMQDIRWYKPWMIIRLLKG